MTFVTPVMEHWLKWEIVQWVHHEGSIWWPIEPWLNTLTTELHLTPVGIELPPPPPPPPKIRYGCGPGVYCIPVIVLTVGGVVFMLNICCQLAGCVVFSFTVLCFHSPCCVFIHRWKCSSAGFCNLVQVTLSTQKKLRFTSVNTWHRQFIISQLPDLISVCASYDRWPQWGK